MKDSKSNVHENPHAESDDETHFDKSLQELKGLCSQLYYAADYCEASFLNAKQKKITLENTKEYLCRAVVTVIDHLGCVSANLDYSLAKNNIVSETELRIDCLNQRLSTCQKYSQQLALIKVHWNADLPRYPRYISPHLKISHAVPRESGIQSDAKDTNKHEFEKQEKVAYNYKPSLVQDSKKNIDAKKNESRSAPVLPFRGGPFILPRAHSFHFEENRKLKRNMLHWKSMQNNDIKSLTRWGKRM